ncbi:hypothetical protein PENSPDRAFT_735049 [Peniophora sp. CONT]|nr:hypothetical protein PENSPDRAFT_735049 [Peniophora sp. CONT]
MSSTPPPPVDIPPYQVQALLDTVVETYGYNSMDGVPTVEVKCAQALGSEIIAGCSNGEILRFVLQAAGPGKPDAYSLYSRQSLPADKPIDEIVLLPSISRAMIHCDRQIYFYTLPSLDLIPSTVIKPIRNVVVLAVDYQHITRPAPPPSDPPIPVEPVDFCIIKRNAIALYSLLDRLSYHGEVPLPDGAFVARRSGAYLCLANRETYGVVNLAAGLFTPLMPISQAPGARKRPMIGVVSPTEFLILSWTGASTMGIFVTGEGDPVRGTLDFPQHPVSISVDYPHVAALLPDQTVQIHSIDSQSVVQTIEPPPMPENITDPMQMLAGERRAVTLAPNGFLVPHASQAAKLRTRRVKLLGRTARPGGRATGEIVSPIDLRDANGRLMASVTGDSEGEGAAGYNVENVVDVRDDGVLADGAGQVQESEGVDSSASPPASGEGGEQDEEDAVTSIEDRTDVAVVE